MLKFDQFADANKASVDTVFGQTGQVFEGVEKLAALNLQAIKASIVEFREGTEAALSAKTPEEFTKLQAAALQAAPQKVLAYGRQVKEILTLATAGQRDAFEAQVSDVQAKFLDAAHGAFKNVPGSEKTLALVKSAVAAANNAYEGVYKATKQASDALETNVTKATETALKSSKKAIATIDA
jgi:phasin family protein